MKIGFLSKLNLSQRISGMIAVAMLTSAVAVGGASLYVSQEAVLDLSKARLAAVRDARRDDFAHYLESIDADLELWADSPVTSKAIQSFSWAWKMAGDDAQNKFQALYIHDNPHPLGEKDKLTKAENAPSDYALAHEEFHPIFRQLKDVRGYYDVFLFDTGGNLIYSVYKELDYATNLVDGEYAESSLGQVFRGALENGVTFIDFAPYAPSHGAAASFIAQPVKNARDETIGVLAFQMPVDRLDTMLTNGESLGETGALLAAGADGLLRHNSDKFGENSILDAKIDGEGFERAIAGETSVTETVDAFGKVVIRSATPMTFHGVTWAFIAEVEADEVLAPLYNLQYILGAIIAGFVAIGVFSALLISRGIVKPIIGIKAAVAELASGGDVCVPGQERHDEVGELARSMERVYQKGLEAARLRSALDGCSTMVMVANRRLEIVYYNHGLQDLLNEHSDEIRKDVPNFDQNNLIGADIDIFHKSPGRIRQMIEGLTTQHSVTIGLGGRRIKLTLSPVINDSGERIGTVVEWNDLTDELKLQSEIERVVEAARAGVLDQTIDAELASGPKGQLASGVNNLVGVIAGVTNDFGDLLAAMANGEFNRTIDAHYEGKFGELKANANETITRIAGIVGEIKTAAGDIDIASNEIRDGAEQLAERTESTAASLEQTSASTTEITTTVRQTAERARSASELANTTSGIAERGRSIASESVEAINAIDKDSEKVSEIVGVIDDIAFQTNLLALNASVEAARAGEAGKGFAVVASEVRTLAQRSSDAAANIRDLITSSNAQVKTGVSLAHRVGDALEEIANATQEVTELIDQIANAANEQASGVDEIGSAIGHMDTITQKNAAMVQETTSAAQRLVDLARRLAEASAFFSSASDEATDEKSDWAA